MVAKPEWGTKRLCPSCGVKFYDLRRNPVTCPKCDSAYPTAPASKPRRSVAVKAKVEAPAAAVKVDPVDAVVAAAGVPDTEDKDDEGRTGSDDKKADKGADLIEDASELGEDEDDVAEVINGIGDDER